MSLKFDQIYQENKRYIRATQGEESRVILALHGLLQDRELVCAGCGRRHEEEALIVSMYNHEGGVEIVPFWPKQWVSVDCHNCEYQTSLQKLRKFVLQTYEVEHFAEVGRRREAWGVFEKGKGYEIARFYDEDFLYTAFPQIGQSDKKRVRTFVGRRF